MSVREFQLTMKPKFLHALMALPKNDQPKITRALDELSRDPRSGGHKKALKGQKNLMRIRADKYRVFYVVSDGYVSVLDVRRRKDDTYGQMPEAEALGAPKVAEVTEDALQSSAPPPAPEAEWHNRHAALDVDAEPEAVQTPLLQPIVPELLLRLRIPAVFHEWLLAIQTEEALLDEARVPDVYRERIIDALTETPLEATAHQPDLLIGDPEDLIRLEEGGLLGFLLKLNPEQEGLVHLGLKSKKVGEAPGPVLLKGGPGTGKSTVALYRTREIVRRALSAGKKPRILFTTYTRALTKFSEQLLVQLLGDNARYVEVATADAVAMRLASRADGRRYNFPEKHALQRLVEEAMGSARFEGNALQVAAQRRTLSRFSLDYLTDEILGVIEARGLETLAEYEVAARPGRRLRLNKTQRAAVWRVRERWLELMGEADVVVFEQVRKVAAQAARDGKARQYDAVVIDEAQDLQPMALAMLTSLCAKDGHLFLTADANQSIYGGAFRWQDIHEDLRFRGRTGSLKANHRSTEQVARAASAYLRAGGALDVAEGERFVHQGPLPVVRRVTREQDELALLMRFFQQARRALRLGVASCAVLCPTRKAGQRIAQALESEGWDAEFMGPQELDLQKPCIKVMTLKSAKGLEFPIVALAGFLDAPYPFVTARAFEVEVAETVDRERRTMFVAMTRAMRALLCIQPESVDGPIWAGIEAGLWNTGRAVAANENVGTRARDGSREATDARSLAEEGGDPALFAESAVAKESLKHG